LLTFAADFAYSSSGVANNSARNWQKVRVRVRVSE
jgi:hypothetical protein